MVVRVVMVITIITIITVMTIIMVLRNTSERLRSSQLESFLFHQWNSSAANGLKIRFATI